MDYGVVYEAKNEGIYRGTVAPKVYKMILVISCDFDQNFARNLAAVTTKLNELAQMGI